MIFRQRERRNEAKAEAEVIAERIGREVVDRAPESLRALAAVPDRFEEIGPSGVSYQIVVEAWSEDRNGNVLRISVSIDGGEVSALRPVGWGNTVRLDG
jgi:hypothetical protein